MQESISTKLTVKSENKYPECVSFQLQAIPVQSGKEETQQLDLYLRVNFQEHWEPLANGSVKLGLKGGELRLHLENAEFTLASEELSGSWVLATEEETLHEENKESKSIERKSYGEKITQEINKLPLNYCQIFQSDQ